MEKSPEKPWICLDRPLAQCFDKYNFLDFLYYCIIYLRNDLQIDLSLDKLKSQPRYPFEYEFTNNKFLD